MSRLLEYIRRRIAEYNARTEQLEAELRAQCQERDRQWQEWLMIRGIVQ